MKNWKVRGTDGPFSDQERLKGNRRIERGRVEKTNTRTLSFFSAPSLLSEKLSNASLE